MCEAVSYSFRPAAARATPAFSEVLEFCGSEACVIMSSVFALCDKPSDKPPGKCDCAAARARLEIREMKKRCAKFT